MRRFEWLVDLLRQNLPSELDFRKEAANAERCRQLLQQCSPTFTFELPQPSMLLSLVIRGAASAFSFLGLLGSPKPDEVRQISADNPRATTKHESVFCGWTKADRTSWQQHSSNADTTRPQLNSHGLPCYPKYDVELYVPRVHHNLTTSRVLVMERCEGVAVNNLEGIVAQGRRKLLCKSSRIVISALQIHYVSNSLRSNPSARGIFRLIRTLRTNDF